MRERQVGVGTNRRRALMVAVATGSLFAIPGLSGCADLINVLDQTCPRDPAESGGIDWTPDILHPVFYGFQDIELGEAGAPASMRIWYPTYEGVTNGAPILKMCLIRWPVVLFMHGQPPAPCLRDPFYNRRWAALARTLAKSGYVVVAPRWSTRLVTSPTSTATLEALAVLDWVRSSWQHRQWIDARAEATAVAGHSFGAILAAQVAAARPSISAYVGWSGPWGDPLLGNPVSVLQAIDAPSFFMWSPNAGTTMEENLDTADRWKQIPLPKYRAVFPGEHFDYLAPQTATDCQFDPQAGCSLIESVAAELSALFIALHVPGNLAKAQIPVSLDAKKPVLTFRQEFFWGGHLHGLEQIKTAKSCSIDLAWEIGPGSGKRHLGA